MKNIPTPIAVAIIAIVLIIAAALVWRGVMGGGTGGKQIGGPKVQRGIPK